MASKVIQVFARFRPPLFDDEIGQPFCVKFQDNSVIVQHAATKRSMQFDFDGAMPPETTQSEVYQRIGAKLLTDVFAGYNCTMMTYGQTGSGKSFTMEGKNFKDQPDVKEGEELDPLAGIVPRLIEDVFIRLKAEAKSNPEFSAVVTASYVEVYRGDLVDCLIPKEATGPASWGAEASGGGKQSKVEVRFPDATGKSVPKLCGHTVIECADRTALRKVYQKGTAGRVVEATNANPVSSRGHGIFDITITQTLGLTSQRKSLFRIVDLAGSEQAENTGQDAARQREAKAINTSLAMLGGVVLGLSQNDSHINYRRDILTRVLEESLGKGNKAILIVTGKPTANNVKSTLNSLRFASTAAFVKGDFFKNERQSREQLERGIFDRDAMLKQKDTEIDELRTKIAQLLADFSSGKDLGGGESGDGKGELDTARLRTSLMELESALSSARKDADQREAELRALLEAKRNADAEGRPDERKESQPIIVYTPEEKTALAPQIQEIVETTGVDAHLAMLALKNSKQDTVAATEMLLDAKKKKDFVAAVEQAEETKADDRKTPPPKPKGRGSIVGAEALSPTGESPLSLHVKGRTVSDASVSPASPAPAPPPVEFVPPPAFSHSETQLMDNLKQACSPQPASYEADDMLKLYNSIPDSSSEAMAIGLPELPAAARDGQLHRSGNLLMSGLMSVLVDKSVECWPPKPACPDTLFTVCPKCRYTNVRSATACYNCQIIKKRLELDDEKTSKLTTIESLPKSPSSSSTPSSPFSPASPASSSSSSSSASATSPPLPPSASASPESKIPDAHTNAAEPPPNFTTPGKLPGKRPSFIGLGSPVSPASPGARGWVTAYFEVSFELQALLVFFRKSGPQIGDNVKVKTSTGDKVGIIRWVGTPSFAPGEWMGLELDSPQGKNDGTVKGVKYFDCPPNHGLFVQPNSIVELLDGKAASWELAASIPLSHASVQLLTKDDYEFFPLTFSLHWSSAPPWIFRALSQQAFQRWIRMLGDYSGIWCEQENRIHQVRIGQDASTFVSGMLRLLRADGAGWQKLFCHVRTEEGIFECFELETLADVTPGENTNIKAAPVILCPILSCEATRVPYEGAGPKRHIFTLKPQWVWKQDPASPNRASRALSGDFDAVKKDRSMSFFSKPAPKPGGRGPERALSLSKPGPPAANGTTPDDPVSLVLMADTQSELDRWVENLRNFQQFKAMTPSAPIGGGGGTTPGGGLRRKGSLMFPDSKLESHMKTKHKHVFSSWHPCYCVLTNSGQLQIYTAKHKGAGQCYMIASMTISETFAHKDRPEKGKAFCLLPKDAQAKDERFYLRCVDSLEHNVWAEAIIPGRSA